MGYNPNHAILRFFNRVGLDFIAGISYFVYGIQMEAHYPKPIIFTNKRKSIVIKINVYGIFMNIFD